MYVKNKENKLPFSKKLFLEHYQKFGRMSNGLDPDQDRCSVGATDLLICKYVKTDLWIYMYVC